MTLWLRSLRADYALALDELLPRRLTIFWLISIPAVPLIGAYAVYAVRDDAIVLKVMRRDLFEAYTAHFDYWRAPLPANAHGPLARLSAPPIVCGGVAARAQTGFYVNYKKFLIDRKTGQAVYESDLMLDKPHYAKATEYPRSVRFLQNWSLVCEKGAMSYPQIRQAFDWYTSTPG